MPVELTSASALARDDARAAALAFGLCATRTTLQLSEEATVARVTTPSHDLAVKVFDASAVDERTVRWRHELAALAAARGLPVPQPLRAADGSLTVTVRLAGRTVLAQASTWSTGVPLAECDVDAALLDEVGRVAARLSLALADAPPPPPHEPHAWDLRSSAATLTEAVARVSDPETRTVALGALRASQGVRDRLDRLPQGVVHHDLHDENLRIGGAGAGRRVVGILDFGDATVGPRIADLVVPAAYAARHCSDPASAVDAVVEGWRSVSALEDGELAAITALAAVRLATNAAVWRSRADGPRGEYARTRSRGSLGAARALLERVR
ncbi:MAG: phosphotransferase [Quadrisphaera sp.]